MELGELYAVVSSFMFKVTWQELKCILGPHSRSSPSSLLLEHETITFTIIYLFICLFFNCFASSPCYMQTSGNRDARNMIPILLFL